MDAPHPLGGNPIDVFVEADDEPFDATIAVARLEGGSRQLNARRADMSHKLRRRSSWHVSAKRFAASRRSYDGADSFTPPRGDSAMKRTAFPRAALAAAAVLSLGVPLTTSAVEPASLRNLAVKSPAPPWPAGDERGMANTLGGRSRSAAHGTWRSRARRSTRRRSCAATRCPCRRSRATRAPVQGHRGRAVLGARLQQRGDASRRRTRAAGHSDRCARPLRLHQQAVGSERSVPR